MIPEEFIHKHICEKLIENDTGIVEATKLADDAVSHWKELHGVSKPMFSYLLDRAITKQEQNKNDKA